MTQQSADFLMNRDNFSEVLVVVKGLVEGTKEYSWVDSEVVLNSETLEEALEEWGWVLEVNDDGDVEGIYFDREKSGDELELFKAIAPFVAVNSFIEMLGEDGLLWRYHFDGKTCIEIEPIIDWDIKQRCQDRCPRCGSTGSYIEKGEKKWWDDAAYQNVECSRCDCEFVEVYEYSYTKIEN
jgi:hypothetical protein